MKLDFAPALGHRLKDIKEEMGVVEITSDRPNPVSKKMIYLILPDTKDCKSFSLVVNRDNLDTALRYAYQARGRWDDWMTSILVYCLGQMEAITSGRLVPITDISVEAVMADTKGGVFFGGECVYEGKRYVVDTGLQPYTTEFYIAHPWEREGLNKQIDFLYSSEQTADTVKRGPSFYEFSICSGADLQHGNIEEIEPDICNQISNYIDWLLE